MMLLMAFALLPLGAETARQKPTVAVVLSGGGARGIAHVAVLEALEERGIPIDMIVGTSMGALIGGLYSAGYSPGDIRELLATHDLMAMLSASPYADIMSTPRAFVFDESNLLSLAFGSKGLGNATGIVGDQALMTLLSSLLARVSSQDDFSELEIPFAAVAIDATTAERIVLDSGPLVSALRASISLPVVFPPYLLSDGRLAMDGGYVDNLPVSLAHDYGADLVIASDVNAAQRLRIEDLTSLSAMVIQSLDLVTRINVRTQEGLADLLIHPDLENVSIMEFNKYQEILDKSQKTIETSYAEALDEFALSLEKQGRTLDIKDSSRRGVYYDLSDPVIVGVQHWEASVGENPVQMMDYGILSRYWKYVDKPLDAAALEQLGRDLEETKKQGVYMSASFELRKKDAPDLPENAVELHIMTRRGEDQKSRLGIGLQGSGALAFSPDGTVALSVLPALLVDVILYDVMPEDYQLTFNFRGTDVLMLQAGIIYDAYSFSRSTYLDLDTVLSLELGNIGLYSTRLNPQRISTFDARVGFSLGATVEWKARASLSAGAKLALTTLGPLTLPDGSTADRKNIGVFAGYLQGSWSTMERSLLPVSGMRADGSLLAGGTLESPSQQPGGRGLWMVRTRFSHAIPINGKLSVSYDAEAAVSQGMPPALADSYFQYGGFGGIPGYGSYLVTDKVTLGAGVQYQVSAGVLPIYLVGVLRLGLRGELETDPGKTVFFMTQDEHDALDSAPLNVFDMGLLAGVSLNSPLGAAILGVGVNLKGGVSLTVEFR